MPTDRTATGRHRGPRDRSRVRRVVSLTGAGAALALVWVLAPALTTPTVPDAGPSSSPDTAASERLEQWETPPTPADPIEAKPRTKARTKPQQPRPDDAPPGPARPAPVDGAVAPSRLVSGLGASMVLSVPDWGPGASWELRTYRTRVDLDAGPSWFDYTTMPGAAGNVGVIGHRTGWGEPFRHTDTLAPGDTLVLDTAKATFRYQVVRAPFSVDESDTQWVAPHPGDWQATPRAAHLTLVTCEIPTSDRRLIVLAKLVSTQPR